MGPPHSQTSKYNLIQAYANESKAKRNKKEATQ
jgi:hypothetical protein